MSSLDQLLQIGEQFFDFKSKTPWLSTIVSLEKNWINLAKALQRLPDTGAIDSIDSLFLYLDNKLSDEDVIAAFESLGLSDLRNKIVAAKVELDNLPVPIRKLTTPFAKFSEAAVALPNATAKPAAYRDDWIDRSGDEGEIKLPLSLFAVKVDNHPAKSSFTVNAAGDANLRVEAGAVWPYSRDKIDSKFLEIALDTTLSAKAGGAAPYQSASISGQLKAEAEAQLLFYFQPENAQQLYAEVLGQSLVALPNPFDLQSIWDSMAFDSLAGQIFAVNGYGLAKIDLGFGALNELPEVLGAALNLSVAVGFKRSAAFVLSARRTLIGGKQALRVAVSQNDSSVRNLGIGAKLALDLSPLFDKVHSILEDSVGQWDKQLEKLRPFLKPGAWIRKNASIEIERLAGDWIKDKAFREAVVMDLGLLLGEDSDESKLKSLLADEITQKLNSVANLASGPLVELVANAKAEILEWLPALARDDVRATLETKLNGWIKSYQVGLAEKITSIADSATGGNKIKNALKAVGVQVDGELDEVDQRVAALRNFIDKFDALIHKVLALAAESANRKILLELSAGIEKVNNTDMEIVGTITSVTSQSKALWQAMMMGRFGSLQKLFDDPDSASEFQLDRDSSLLSKYSKSESKTGLIFIGFGVELKVATLLSSEAEVTRYANGDISVVARAELTKDSRGPKEARSVSFTSFYDLMLAKAQARDDQGLSSSRRGLALNIVASHKDTSLKASEVREFVESLSSRGLIFNHRVERAMEVYEGWSTSRGTNSKHPRGDIEISFALEQAELGRLLVWGRAISAELTNGGGQETRLILGAAFDAFMASGFMYELVFDDQMAELRDYDSRGLGKSLSDKDWLIHVLQFERRRVGPPTKLHFSAIRGAFVSSDREVPSEVGNIVKAMNSVANLLHLMAEIYDANPRSAAFPNGWDEDSYGEREALLAESTRDWLDLGSEWIFWFKDRLGGRTASFLSLMIGLSRGAGNSQVITEISDPHFKITMLPRDSGGKAGTLIVI